VIGSERPSTKDDPATTSVATRFETEREDEATSHEAARSGEGSRPSIPDEVVAATREHLPSCARPALAGAFGVSDVSLRMYDTRIATMIDQKIAADRR